MTNELGEEIIIDELSLNDIFGWMDQKSNRYFKKGVDTLIYNRRYFDEREVN